MSVTEGQIRGKHHQDTNVPQSNPAVSQIHKKGKSTTTEVMDLTLMLRKAFPCLAVNIVQMADGYSIYFSSQIRLILDKNPSNIWDILQLNVSNTFAIFGHNGVNTAYPKQIPQQKYLLFKKFNKLITSCEHSWFHSLINIYFRRYS